VEAKRGRDDDIEVSSGGVFDWAGHFSPVPYERDRTAPAKRSTYTSPASSRAWEAIIRDAVVSHSWSGGAYS
jgi:hypothetical protein